MKRVFKKDLIKSILVALVVLVGIFIYLLILNKNKQNIFQPNYVASNLPVGSFSSKLLDYSFNYPVSWGRVLLEGNEWMKGDSWEYIHFEKNEKLFALAGEGDRGNIVDGLQIKLDQEIKITTQDGHGAQINIYTDPDLKYWIEALVWDKTNKLKEIFYIKYFGALTKEELSGYRSYFTTLLKSFSL